MLSGQPQRGPRYKLIVARSLQEEMVIFNSLMILPILNAEKSLRKKLETKEFD